MSALKRFIPLLDRVLVEKVAPMAQTAGGILLPDSAVSKINEAVVVAAGAGGRTRDGTTLPLNVKIGDKVMLPEYGGQQVKLDDKEYFLFRDEDILAKLE